MLSSFKKFTNYFETCLNVHNECYNAYLIFVILQINKYSLGEQGSKAPSGNVVSDCNGKQIGHIPLISFAIQSYSIKGGGISALLIEGLFAIILAIVGSVVVLKWHLEDRVKLSYTYSYNHYGFWWGVNILVSITLPFMLRSDLSQLIEHHNEYASTLGYSFVAAMLVLCVLSGVPITIYFVYKTKQPPAIPYILMMPLTVLFCCCNTKRAKLLVFGVALWIDLVAVPLTAYHGVAILLTVIVEPFAVITNTLVLVLTLFCLANIFALLFTIFAYIFTRKHQRPQGEGTTMLRAIILILLLVMVGCFGLFIGVMGYLVNADTKQGSFVSMARSASVPLILGLVTFGLKKLISKWLDKAPNSNPLVREDSARVELLQSV